jgi:hypothetical protein
MPARRRAFLRVGAAHPWLVSPRSGRLSRPHQHLSRPGPGSMDARPHKSIPRYIIWDPTSGPSDLPNVPRLRLARTRRRAECRARNVFHLPEVPVMRMSEESPALRSRTEVPLDGALLGMLGAAQPSCGTTHPASAAACRCSGSAWVRSAPPPQRRRDAAAAGHMLTCPQARSAPRATCDARTLLVHTAGLVLVLGVVCLPHERWTRGRLVARESAGGATTTFDWEGHSQPALGGVRSGLDVARPAILIFRSRVESKVAGDEDAAAPVNHRRARRRPDSERGARHMLAQRGVASLAGPDP